MNQPAMTNVLDRLDAVRDVMTVTRVFGEPYRVADTTLIPVASARGGGGGGGGEGTGPTAETNGSGAGLGFGADVRPLGVYVVDADGVHWRPAVDALRIVLRTEIVVAVALVVLGRLLARRRT